ncbi:MAG: PLDc N-terminal domain-containing protein [Chitinophagaceae bacterium]|nr:PLDc N-terminal domain-containing protein [Chitinophagaceae bacterium]
MEIQDFARLAFIALLLLIYVWAIIDIQRRRFATEKDRRFWVNIVFFLPVFGSLYYLFALKAKRWPK